jgi:hypothetical protein
MFADAYERASHFTAPVAISSLTVGGKVETGLGAFVIVNNEGWFITAAHIFQAWAKGQNDRQAIDDRDAKLAEIDANDKLTPAKKKTLKRREREDPDWFKDWSYWWALDQRGVADVKTDDMLDLAIGRLDPFDPASVAAYPVFRGGTEDVRPGTSVCRLGFPFHEIETTFDPALGFVFPPGALPIPRFPNDGIITRTLEGDTVSPRTGVRPTFFETSTPGLRGQSGGPVFDADGVVYGIQSRTIHLPLGFSPEVEQLGRRVTEHQFLNAGLAAHPRTVTEFLTHENVAHATT